MGVKAFTDGIAALLVTDASFTAAISALIGTPVTRVLRANTPWEQIGAAQLPCFVIEQSPGKASPWATGDASGMTIGHSQQQFESELDVCLLWNTQDREAAADQRAQLPDLFASLLMRNPQPGGIDAAWLQEWLPDQGIRHPLQCWVARIRAEYVIEKAP
jgi:hypothetical protein